MTATRRGVELGVVLAVCLGLATGPALGAETTWPMRKLPGCEDLPRRMAAFYRPVEVRVKPAARQYKLPLDLSRLNNPNFGKLAYPFQQRDLAAKANALLAKNGFVVFPAGRFDDVVSFYKAVKSRGMPVFITSDSLLHLYHIQFDETLKGVEEREFVKDLLAISRAIQAEAVKLHASTSGDLKKAARLLAGYATVPVMLLGRTDVSAEAAEALEELNSWPARPGWRRRDAFVRKYSQLFEVIRKEQRLPPQRYGLNVPVVKRALQRYLKAHPVAADAAVEPVPEFVADDVKAELALIAAHKGFASSPLFTYKEDYSQYVPRGHYTRSKKLRQYFKAMMWYGRMTFLIRGRTGRLPGLVPMPVARVQTLAACMLAGMMESKLPDGRSLAEAWDRLYAVTAYYVGLADDLTPYEYRSAMRVVFDGPVRPSSLLDVEKFFQLRSVLAKLRKPAIYSGLGDMELPPADFVSEADLAKALALTQGLRLMGQRYVPDSYLMGKLVYPIMGRFTGRGSPFTLVRSRGGPIRGFPRGLDVMAVLGSKRARHWLKELGDDQYVEYEQTLNELKADFEKIGRADWNRNLYWSWLYALRALLREYPQGYPTFMRTEAWADKQLATALASWAQLRHDTILYVKQSYTMLGTTMAPRPRMVEGYVEPVPEFYARLLALTRMTLRGLEHFRVLDNVSRNRLHALERILSRLLRLAQRELAGEKLTDEDYQFIRSFGANLRYAVAGVRKRGLETTIVADVHTDANSGQVLEEGTGYLNAILVAYPMPDGGVVVGMGPVLSHYEFKHPLSNRLTDEAWKQMLRAGRAPAPPAWTATFTVRAARPARRTGRPGYSR